MQKNDVLTHLIVSNQKREHSRLRLNDLCDLEMCAHKIFVSRKQEYKTLFG